jgi:hypothetical protein
MEILLKDPRLHDLPASIKESMIILKEMDKKSREAIINVFCFCLVTSEI